jgi:hypothetical protein
LGHNEGRNGYRKQGIKVIEKERERKETREPEDDLLLGCRAVRK